MLSALLQLAAGPARTLAMAVLAMFIFRTLPLAGWAIVAVLRGWSRLLFAAGYAALLTLYLRASGSGLDIVLATAGTIAWFALLGLLVHALPPLLRADRFDRVTLLVGCLTVFLVIPALLVRGDALLVVLVMGFELVFSAYSYVVDVATLPNKRPRLGETLFFLLINPALVFRSSGSRRGQAALDLVGLRRVALGVTALFGNQLLLLWLSFSAAWLDRPEVAPWASWHSYLQFLARNLLMAAAIYLAHSGVASVQIGALRSLGYVVPERYHYPFLASGVADFWRRWNRYVGQWLELYVFRPVVKYAGRTELGVVREARIGLGVLAAFGVSGVIHQCVQLTAITQARCVILLAFALNGLIVMIGTYLSSRASARSSSSQRLRAQLLGVLSRVVIVHLTVLNVWLLIPLLSGQGLPRALVAWVG